jgi:hypothetical protein
MDDRSVFRSSTRRDRFEFFRPLATAAVLTVLAAAPLVLLAALVPRPLVLPVLSIVALIIGALAGAVAWAGGANRGGDRITLWDVSGAFVLIGCVASALSDPNEVLQLGNTALQ